MTRMVSKKRIEKFPLKTYKAHKTAMHSSQLMFSEIPYLICLALLKSLLFTPNIYFKKGSKRSKYRVKVSQNELKFQNSNYQRGHTTTFLAEVFHFTETQCHSSKYLGSRSHKYLEGLKIYIHHSLRLQKFVLKDNGSNQTDNIPGFDQNKKFIHLIHTK